MNTSTKIEKTQSGNLFTIDDLSGGLNIKTSAFNVADNEAIGLINFVFTESGILTSRKGYKKHNSVVSTMASNGWYGLFRFYKKDESTKYLIGTGGTGIAHLSDDGSTETSLTINETLIADQRFQFAVFNDYCFMTNGANKPLVWSGTGNVRQMGIVAPSAGSSGASTTGGSCTDGLHQIRITYHNSTDDTESTHYTLTSQTCGSGDNTIPLSSLAASSDPQVDKIKIYMTIKDGTIFYFVAERPDTTATYDISISDTGLQGNVTYDAADFYPPPTSAKFIELAKRRIFLFKNASYKSRIYWSEVDQPEYFASNSYRDINPDDGDVGTGILLWNDYLYIFKENSTYVLTDPSDPANSPLREIARGVGCISPYTLATGFFQRPVSRNDWLLIPGIILNTRFGIQGFDGNQYHPLSERVEPILNSLYEVNIQEMVGFFNKHKYYLSYTPKKGTATAGGYVEFKQAATDVGDEQKNATYDTNHDPTAYSSTYDARIDLTNTSAANEDLEIEIYVDWNFWKNPDDEELAIPQQVFYEIFVSTDSGTTWTSKGAFKKSPAGISYYKKDCVFISNHKFNDSSITNVRLDYFKNEFDDLPGANYIQLKSVAYQYEYSAAVLGSNVVNNRILYYDSLQNAWSDWRNIKANCFCAWNGASDENEEFFGSSNLGYVHRMNIGFDDDGQNIFTLYQSGYYDCKDRAKRKRFNAIILSSDVFSDILNIEVFVDRVQRQYWKINLLPPYDFKIYHNEKYHGEAVGDNVMNMIQKSLRMPANSTGRYISLKLWASSRSELQIKDFSMRYIPRSGIR